MLESRHSRREDTQSYTFRQGLAVRYEGPVNCTPQKSRGTWVCPGTEPFQARYQVSKDRFQTLLIVWMLESKKAVF
jgi:hypothetical protein